MDIGKTVRKPLYVSVRSSMTKLNLVHRLVDDYVWVSVSDSVRVEPKTW